MQDAFVKASWREVRETRKKYEGAKCIEGRLSLESHPVCQAAQDARSAFEAAIAEYIQKQDSKTSQQRLAEIGRKLRVEELAIKAAELSRSLQTAQANRESLAKLLASQESWFACNEVLGFVQDRERRYSKTPLNFAKAMAGLPFYDWLYSVRRCTSIPAVAGVPTTYLFQLFEMLRGIANRTKPANLMKIELRLKNQLLKQGTDPLFRSYISPRWFHMTLAFADCRGKRVRRAYIPYKVMGRFLDHCEGPSVAEAELAKHHQLV
ncbi:MAG TPA: hypothetical protein VMU26_07305 [Candidatus Polarisedimenticolia bacterium]|nr:hypothetical protein [Candidatus Polarisedimenticolia bacterium]